VKKPYLKSLALKLTAIFSLMVIAIMIHSCKKDNHAEQQASITNAVIAQAKTWYESTYPVNNDGKLSNQSIINGSTSVDYSKIIKPDWTHAANYTRFDNKVVEIPIDPSSSKLGTALSNSPTGTAVYKKENSLSSFLLINDGQSYQAYIMTIIADPSYLKNDLTKLGNDKYNKRDSDFSGVVLYTTPKGKFVSGWFYKNGTITNTLFPHDNTTGNAKTQVQSVHTNDLQEDCTYWYQQVDNGDGTSSWIYLDKQCSITGSAGDGGTGDGGPAAPPASGGGGNSGNTPSTPKPQPCAVPNAIKTQVQSTDGHLVVNKNIVQPPGDGDGTFPPPPPPTPPAPCTTVVSITIKTDTLTKNFPCATKLIIDNLLAIRSYNDLMVPFETSQKPDLVWTTKDLQWNPNGGGQTELGNTGRDLSGGANLGSLITLNNKMLQNSSMLMIASTAIHESLHAFINYNIALNVANNDPNFKFNGSWMNELDFFYDQNALPANYRDHYEMMGDYFDKVVAILALYDNNAHTQKEYAMSMLYGLDTADPNATATEKSRLDQEFNTLKLEYNITDTELNTFYNTQLSATSNKLPTSGC
jgi:hypothetical protein